MDQLDDTIAESLTSFVADVFAISWWGKEREAVSLFAFRYLVAACRPGTVLYDPAQIAIEVRVPQPAGVGVKAEICKDLVIWPEPGWTCWNERREAARIPIAVLEWKVNTPGLSDRDIAWLHAFATQHSVCTGYAISLDLHARNERLCCARVSTRGVDRNWLNVARIHG